MEGEFITYDKQKIFYKAWKVDDPKAVIQIFHGLGEMAFYYEEFAKAANEKGFSVYLNEYRGHGRTKAEYNKENIFVQDAKDSYSFNQLIRQENPGKPVYILSHSLGTIIAREAVHEHSDYWDKAVLIGLPHQTGIEDLLKSIENEIAQNGEDAPNAEAANQMFGNLNNGLEAENSTLAWLTHDEEKRDYYESLPYTNVSYSNRFYYDFLKFIQIADSYDVSSFENKELPVLILAGSEDLVSDHGEYCQDKAYDLRDAGFKKVDFKIYPGLRHSILQEVARKDVQNDILSWLS